MTVSTAGQRRRGEVQENGRREIDIDWMVARDTA
jgi:hypothetical protein